ncbi:MAG: GspH/FimT family protein [Desulfobacterales bacterium]|nr:GspH/FimT family protein [Desulfobacterales bacterium]
MNKKSFIAEKNKGFSFIELVVVIVIIGLLSLVAAPGIMTWRAKAQFSKSTRDIFSFLQHARMKAIKTGVYCSITFDNSANSFLVYLDSDTDLSYDSGEEVVRSVSLADYNVEYDDSFSVGDPDYSLAGRSITFIPNGLPKEIVGARLFMGRGSVYLKDSHNRTKRIQISPTGNIKIL